MIKRLLPGLVPLILFILVDEFWGMKAGLVAAVSIGLAELLYTWIREKRLEKFVLLDTFLLLLLSALSWFFENDIFFRIKPAMINLVLMALLVLSIFTPLDLVGAMSQRYLNGEKMNEAQKALFRKNLRIMLYLVILHTLLVLWTAFYASKEVWGFVSSFGLFLMMGVYLAIEWLKRGKFFRREQQFSDAEEWLPVVEEDGKIVGKALRSYCHNGSKVLHPVVHLHVMGGDGSLFLQKRSETKKVQPGKWDTAVGGHLTYGETIEDALNREAGEEIGLFDFHPEPVLRYRWNSDIESELVYCFLSRNVTPSLLSSEEMTEGRFWSIKEIRYNLGKEVFTPNFEHEFALLDHYGVLKKK
ncbi:MAG: NUDIX domain-containing protein [Marinilabiliales bacterium]|nr:NUDIX domain-containing protein [Marinilabiliales bacterium]